MEARFLLSRPREGRSIGRLATRGPLLHAWSAAAERTSAVRAGIAHVRDVCGRRTPTEPQNGLTAWFLSPATRTRWSTPWSWRARRASSDGEADRPSTWRRAASSTSEFAARRGSATLAPESPDEQKRGAFGDAISQSSSSQSYMKPPTGNEIKRNPTPLGPPQPRQPLARPTPRRRYPPSPHRQARPLLCWPSPPARVWPAGRPSLRGSRNATAPERTGAVPTPAPRWHRWVAPAAAAAHPRPHATAQVGGTSRRRVAPVLGWPPR